MLVKIILLEEMAVPSSALSNNQHQSGSFVVMVDVQKFVETEPLWDFMLVMMEI